MAIVWLSVPQVRTVDATPSTASLPFDGGGQREHAPSVSGAILGRSPAAARTRFPISNGSRPPRRGPRIGGRRQAAATDLARKNRVGQALDDASGLAPRVPA